VASLSLDIRKSYPWKGFHQFVVGRGWVQLTETADFEVRPNVLARDNSDGSSPILEGAIGSMPKDLLHRLVVWKEKLDYVVLCLCPCELSKAGVPAPIRPRPKFMAFV
jgi:hypothetical protein